MATLFDVPDTTVSFPIVKMEETPDGDLVVYGKATDGSVDSDDQIVDHDWSGKALETWLKTGGNVRVQHSPQLYPAGKGIEVEVGKDGAHWVRSLIVEDTAKNLVRKGVLTAYSVGIARPQIVRDARARGGRIVGGQIAELSLVDRPANKNCGITLVKSDGAGSAEFIGKVFGDVDADVVNKVGPHGYEHGWIKVGDTELVSPSKGVHYVQHAKTGERYGSIHANKDKTFSAHVKTGSGDFKHVGNHSSLAEARQSVVDHRNRLKSPGVSAGGGSKAGTELVSPSKGLHYVQATNGSKRYGAIHANSDGTFSASARVGQGDFQHLGEAPSLSHAHQMIVDHHGLSDNVGKGDMTDTLEKGEDLVTATVSFTPKDLATILGKAKKPKVMEDADADPTDDNGGPDDEDAMDEKDDVGGGSEDATSPEPKGKDLSDEDKGRIGKAAGPYDVELEKREFSADERQAAADAGHAMPDGSYPIKNTSDLGNAVQAFGRAKNPGAVKQHIKRRAAALGATDQLPDSWKTEEPEIKKTAKVPCPKCGKMTKSSASFCGKCGAKMATPDVEKGMATPASASGARAKDMTPVPAHREPDGPQMERFEDDLGMQEGGGADEKASTNVPGWDWDSTNPRPSSSAGTSLKSEAPIEIKRLHDLTCAAFSAKSINETYPHLRSIGDAINVEEWRQKALTMVSRGSLDGAEHALSLAKAAEYLHAAPANDVAGAHAELHKAFSEMYPDVKVTPTELDPGRYRRPYLSDGHARNALSGQGSQPPQPRANQITAQDYQRGDITEGHQRPSPGNKGNNAGAPGGMAAGVYIGNAARAQAAASMKNLHDHISDTYPSLCPMTATGVPARAVGKAETNLTNGETVTETVNPSTDYVGKAANLTAGPGVVTPDVIKAAVAEALAERDTQIELLKSRLIELERMPDPYQSAYRGPGITKSHTTTQGTPEESLSVVEKEAKRRNEALFGYLQHHATYAPSPAERESARQAMAQLFNHGQ